MDSITNFGKSIIGKVVDECKDGFLDQILTQLKQCLAEKIDPLDFPIERFEWATDVLGCIQTQVRAKLFNGNLTGLSELQFGDVEKSSNSGGISFVIPIEFNNIKLNYDVRAKWILLSKTCQSEVLIEKIEFKIHISFNKDMVPSLDKLEVSNFTEPQVSLNNIAPFGWMSEEIIKKLVESKEQIVEQVENQYKEKMNELPELIKNLIPC